MQAVLAGSPGVTAVCKDTWQWDVQRHIAKELSKEPNQHDASTCCIYSL